MSQSRRSPLALRTMLRVLVALAPLLVVLFSTERAEAYTWMIKHSYGGCAVCHADPSGGEVLTLYGRAQSDLLLRTRYGGGPAEEAEPSKAAGFLWFADLPPSVMLGGSVRLASTLKDSEFRAFPMQLDLYGQLKFGDFFAGGSVGAAKVPAGSPHARAAQITTNQADGYNAISRTHYLGLDLPSLALTLRAGRLNIPFGIRIPEHTAWVREGTRTDRESDQQHGLAVAYNGETVRGEGMVILGNYQVNPDEFRERGYSFYFEAMASSRAAIGVSSLYTLASRDRHTLETNVARGAHGPFTRLAVIDEFAVLAEFDLITDSTRDLGYVGFLQGDVEIIQGVHGMLTGEVLDAGYPKSSEAAAIPRTSGVGKPSFGAWVSAGWFFLPHLDLRVDAIIRSDFQLLTQLHAFL